MAELALRDGLDQPRPLAQIDALLADVRLLPTLAETGSVTLRCGNWLIGVQDLQSIQQRLCSSGLRVQRLQSNNPHTRVAAAALGLEWQPQHSRPSAADSPAPDLRVHQGTLRSGDHLEVDGSLLVLGDVNPGARVSAGGHVLVWGTLRGVAHAGKDGDTTARITALQLRPLQLRIAAAVARGPEDLPISGFAEQAELIDGLIAINPAAPQWPLSG